MLIYEVADWLAFSADWINQMTLLTVTITE